MVKQFAVEKYAVGAKGIILATIFVEKWRVYDPPPPPVASRVPTSMESVNHAHRCN